MSDRISDPEILDAPVEEPVDAPIRPRRYLEAVRRRARPIAVVSVGVAVLVALFSLLMPKSYTATARIAASTQGAAPSASTSSTVQRSLATIQAYITSAPVLAAAAGMVGRESAGGLHGKITTSLDAHANIIDLTARDAKARRAAKLANAVADTFLFVRAARASAQLAREQSLLTQRVRAAQAAGTAGLVSALQAQISNLAVQQASAGSDLQLLAPAQVPGTASSPRPIRNAVFAFVAALLLSVLVVAGRELIAPSVSRGRELSALIGSPILGRVPRVADARRSRAAGPTAAEAEAYRFLSKSLELSVSARRPRLVAVTSAVRNEGKTTVVSRLGAALAEMGRKTLLISADLHWPTLHEEFGIPLGSGLSNLLGSINGRQPPGQPRSIKRVRPDLYMLTSGRPPSDPAAVLNNDVVQRLFERIRELDWDYVLFDLPPLLAAAETQLFVRHADAAVLVSFAGRTRAEQLMQARELLDRLAVRPTGIVLLGVLGEDAPTPYARRFTSVRGAGESA